MEWKITKYLTDGYEITKYTDGYYGIDGYELSITINNDEIPRMKEIINCFDDKIYDYSKIISPTQKIKTRIEKMKSTRICYLNILSVIGEL